MGADHTMSGACRPSAPRRPAEKSLLSILLAVLRYADGRMRKRRSRLDLLDLTDDQLRDIGVTRAEARREGSRPFWD